MESHLKVVGTSFPGYSFQYFLLFVMLLHLIVLNQALKLYLNMLYYHLNLFQESGALVETKVGTKEDFDYLMIIAAMKLLY